MTPIGAFECPQYRAMMRGYDPTGAVMYPSLMKDFVNLEFNLFLLLVRRALQALFKTRRSTSPMTSPLGCVCFHWSLQSLPTLNYWTTSLFSHPGPGTPKTNRTSRGLPMAVCSHGQRGSRALLQKTSNSYRI